MPPPETIEVPTPVQCLSGMTRGPGLAPAIRAVPPHRCTAMSFFVDANGLDRCLVTEVG
jgi:hypothetical protein